MRVVKWCTYIKCAASAESFILIYAIYSYETVKLKLITRGFQKWKCWIFGVATAYSSVEPPQQQLKELIKHLKIT